MKLLLSVAGIIINYCTYAQADPSHGNNYYCDKLLIDSEVVEKGRYQACRSLSASPWWEEFPAAVDGSKIFGVKDATLFSWPLYRESLNEWAAGSISTLRAIIDPMCKLVGVVNRINNSYQKCIQPLSPKAIQDLSLELSLRYPFKSYGIDCHGYVFFHKELDTAYRFLIFYSAGSALPSFPTEQADFFRTHIFSEPGSEMLFSWPVPFKTEISTPSNLLRSAFRATINQSGDTRGMIHKIGGSWRRCNDILYTDKIPWAALNKYKTSVGEDVSYVDSNFSCGYQIITATTINSHMQVACQRLHALVKSGNVDDDLYPWSPPEMSHKSNPPWYWPVRKPELFDGQEQGNTMHQMISLGSNCEFLGVYYLVNNLKKECKVLNKSATQEPKSKKRKSIDLN